VLSAGAEKIMMRRSLKWLWIGLLTLALIVSFSFYSRNSVAELPLIQTPLSARGATLVDATGRSVMLRGVNWFGIETDTHVPHGLWARDYKEMLSQMKDLGYNMIRLPYSVQTLRETTVKGIDYSIGSNKDLEGKTPLEVMDRIIAEAGENGLLVLLDSHRLNDKAIPELWYGDGFTEQDWIGTWTMLAQRYRNQANVIGADLKNEPHGIASWGTSDVTTDWRMAAERAGEAILKVNPDWLIVVEGVENNVPGQALDTHWWGGNLEGVRNYPVRLSKMDKLVYSPHEYGSGVYPQQWFNDRTFPNNLYRRWEIGFQYIARLKLAPILVGEFGGHKIGYFSKEGVWQRQFMEYLGENSLNFAYWSWNPNSDNTGGILEDNWRSVDGRKQRYLSRLLEKISFVGATVARIDTTAVPIASLPPAPETSIASSTISESKEQKPSGAPLIPSISEALESPAPQSLFPNPADLQAEAPRPESQPGSRPESQPEPQPESSRIEALPPEVSAPEPPKTVAEPGQARIAQPTEPSPTEILIARAGNLRYTTHLDSDWQTGFCYRVQVTNTGSSRSPGWYLTFRMSDAVIDNSWGGRFDRQDSEYTVEPFEWGRSLYPDQTVDLGFCATKEGGEDYEPRQVTLRSE
jgi:endoglucanase